MITSKARPTITADKLCEAAMPTVVSKNVTNSTG